MKKFVLLILFCLLTLAVSSETVTYTVTGRNSVAASGSIPKDSYVDFYQSGSGQSGQMTAGNYTQLTLFVDKDILVNSIQLYMRSNTSSGAGSMRIFANTRTIYSKEVGTFSSSEWAGEYTTAFVPLSIDLRKDETVRDSLRIIIAATENSIYIQSYVINYTLAPQECYAVNLLTNTPTHITTLKETEPGSGVVLPQINDCGKWLFYGWSYDNIVLTTTEPACFAPGTIFYPLRNETLYALFVDSEGTFWRQRSDMIDGDYIMTSDFYYCYAYGNVNDKRLATRHMNLSQKVGDSYVCSLKDVPQNAIYTISFLEDSTATIIHKLSGEYISPSSSSEVLTKEKGTWKYRVLTDNSVLFYLPINESYAYTLYMFGGQTLADLDSVYVLNKKLRYDTYERQAMIMFNLTDLDNLSSARFTSYPLTNNLDDIKNQNIDYHDSFVYTISGQFVGRVGENELPYGVYVIQQNNTKKRIVVK